MAPHTAVGANTVMGTGEDAPSEYDRKIYAYGLVTVGENSVIPSDVLIGKNTVISGETKHEDYPGGVLKSGGAIIRTDRKDGDSE